VEGLKKQSQSHPERILRIPRCSAWGEALPLNGVFGHVHHEAAGHLGHAPPVEVFAAGTLCLGHVEQLPGGLTFSGNYITGGE
jgi:hypothetical protein